MHVTELILTFFPVCIEHGTLSEIVRVSPERLGN